MKLPLKYPFISAIPHHAFTVSIMMNYNQCLPWIFSNFTQLYLEYDKNSENEWVKCFDYLTLNPEYHYNPWFHTYSQRVTRNTVKLMPNLIDFIIRSLHDGYYLWFFLNEYYIPNTNSYQRYAFPHAILIYGVDEEQGIFNIAGFFENTKFGFSHASFEQIEQSFYNFEFDGEHLNLVHLLKINPSGHNGYAHELNLGQIIIDIVDYLQSKNTYERLRVHHFNFKVKVVYGLQIYEHLVECIKLGIFNKRDAFIVWEHKDFMIKRLKYIRENDVFISEKIITEFIDMKKQALIALNLFLKYRIKLDHELLERIIDIYSDIEYKEKFSLEMLIQDLQFQRQ